MTGPMEDGEEREKEEGEEQAAAESGMRKVLDVRSPTRQEREQHELTHHPDRSWCNHCVRGKAKEDHHRKSKNEPEERRIPLIAFDCCFLGKGDESANPILVSKDEESKAMKGFWCNEKGWGDGSSVKTLKQLVDESWGRNRSFLKADKEVPLREIRK